MKNRFFIALFEGIFIITILALSPILRAQVFVLDEVGLLSEEEVKTLGQELEAYEIETSHEVAIRIVDSLDLSEKSIRFYAASLFEELGIGKVGVDNGILIMLAPKNRKVAIELGYGIEPYISDLNAEHIIKEYLAPHLKEEQYLMAFQKAVRSIRYYLKDFRVLDAQSDSLLIDEMGLLSTKEKATLSQELAIYEEKSGHKTWIRILEDESNDQVSHKIAQQLFEKLEDPESDTYQTLIYIGVHELSNRDFAFSHHVIHNWAQLALDISEKDDHYYFRYDNAKASDLIAYRLQLKVLFGNFRVEKYYTGILKVLKYLKKIHRQEITSSQITSPAIYARDFDFSLLIFIPLILVCVLGFFFGGAGGGGGGPSGSSGNTWSGGGSGGSSYGGGSSSGSSGSGGSYGGGSFGGGSSGGGGADGDY